MGIPVESRGAFVCISLYFTLRVADMDCMTFLYGSDTPAFKMVGIVRGSSEDRNYCIKSELQIVFVPLACTMSSNIITETLTPGDSH